jgi:TPR repeat protein
MSQTNYSRYKYTPDEIDEQEFLAKFIIRNHDFDEIFEDIKQTDYSVPSQHCIIIGQRGQGKTTLLRKVMLEVQSDADLSSFLVPIKFSEEQYQIRSLSRLWEEVADYLQSIYEDDFANILDDMETHFEDADYDLHSFSYLEKAVKAKNKKLILLIDNIDELLGKLKEKEQRRLREILLTSATFKIIGGSTKMLEQHYDYGKPFFEFFKIIKLTGLNKQECLDFIASIGDEAQQKKIATIIRDTPERIETLRRLTGGVPRTLIMLFDVFIDDAGNAFDDLLKILDDATPLYKHRMDDLPDTLQDITHTISMNWDGIATKDIAKKTRLASKVVSAQLKQLESKYGIVESTSIGKNKIYKIEERFFNIWYLMRFGRKKDRQKVEWLVNFLTSWCSSTELELRASRFIRAVKKGEMKPSYVYHMCEALSYAGLDIEVEHEMKQGAKTYLSTIQSNYAEALSQSDRDILKQAIQLSTSNKKPQAIKVLVKSQKTSQYILAYLAHLYLQEKHFDKAEECYLKAIENGDNNALFNLGNLYNEQKQFGKAEEYYLKAIEKEVVSAANSLSWCYFKQGKNIEKALRLISEDYLHDQNYQNTHTFALMLLWAEDFSDSYEKFSLWLNYPNAEPDEIDIFLYLNLLMAKKQLYKAKEILEMPEHQLKDKYKPIWYALMTLMQDEYPHEITKMGSELQESVDEVLQEIEELKNKYTLA